MKIRKLFCAALALCLMLVLPMNADAAEVDSGTCGENLTWTLDDEGLLVISGEGDMDDYGADSDESSPWSQGKAEGTVKKVRIESGVTSVGAYAFNSFAYLKEVEIVDTVERIGERAFAFCPITKVDLPDGLTAIENEVFLDCTDLTELELPDGVKTIGIGAFNGCSGLTELVIPEGVTSIGNSAFANCSGLTELVIPKGVESIGSSVFSGCSGLTEMVIHEGITEIGDYMFYDCENLASVSLPEGIESIGEYAFQNCASLKKIAIPDAVETIGRSAFEDCASLTSVKIPDGVTVIDLDVFSGCTSLKRVTLPDSVTSIEQDAFEDCTKLSGITLPDKLTYIGCSAFTGSGLKKVTIPDSVTCLDDGAFEECTKLTSVVFEDDPKVANSDLEIEPSVFAECTNLASVELPGDLKSIDTGAFEACESLFSITIPDYVTTVYTNAFLDCTNLAYVCFEDDPDVADSDLSIGANAFDNCQELVSVIFAKDVASIGREAFSGCYDVEQFVFQGDAPGFGSDVFANTQADAYYPEGNSTWTSQKKDDYSGEINWVAYDHEVTKAPSVSGTNVASSGKNKLTWKKLSGASEYQVYRAASRKGPYKLVSTTTDTSYTDSASKAETTYYYYVVAVNKDDIISAPSNFVSRTCDLPRPTLTLSNVASSGKIRLKWEPVEGAVEYEIYRSTDGGESYQLLTATTKTTAINSSVEVGVAYRYRIKAIAEKTAANSAASSAKERMCDLPRPVGSVKLNNAGKPFVDWDDIDGATGYKVYIYDADGDLVKAASATGSRATHSSAVSGATYHYRIVAVHSNSSANSAKSARLTITAE